MIFCLIIAVTLLFVVPRPETENHYLMVLSIHRCRSMYRTWNLGTGISSGATGAAACSQIADNPESYSILSRTSMLAQGFIETVVLYTVLLSFLMILFR